MSHLNLTKIGHENNIDGSIFTVVAQPMEVNASILTAMPNMIFGIIIQHPINSIQL